MDEYLESADFIDSDHPAVMAYANEVIGNEQSASQQIKLLFDKIRDQFAYLPFAMDLRAPALKASHQLSQPTGYCVTKALLLSACARAIGVPARVCFFNVRNHLGTGKLEEVLKTDLIVFHGSSEVYLNGKWLKLVPAFDQPLCERLGVSVIEFDGKNDAIFQQYKRGTELSAGQFMEYVKEYGSFADFPYQLARVELEKYYPSAFDQSVPIDQRVLFKHW